MMSIIGGDIGGIFTANNISPSDFVPLYVSDQWHGQVGVVCAG